jgi:DNA-binding transcriptional LysR family regulator
MYFTDCQAMVNYELLRTFVTAAHARTFAEAAATRRVTTSAVSQQVKTLEVQLGAALFERLGRRVRLTDAGRALAATLRLELGRIEEALEAARAAQAQVSGRVAIGSPRTFGRYWLRPRLPALLRAHPALQLSVTFDVPSVLERRLVEGTLDLAVLARAPELPAIQASRLAVETFVAVGPPRTRASGLDALLRLRWVAFDEDLAMLAPWWRASVGRRARLPQVVCHIASLEEMLSLVEEAGLCAVLPDYHVAAALAARRVVALDPPEGKRPVRNPIYLASRRGAVDTARLLAVREALAK